MESLETAWTRFQQADVALSTACHLAQTALETAQGANSHGVNLEGIGSKGRDLWMRVRLRVEETRARWGEWVSALVDLHAKLRVKTRKLSTVANNKRGRSPALTELKSIRYMRHMVREGILNATMGDELKELTAVVPSPKRVSNLAGYFNDLERQFKAAQAINEDGVDAFLAEIAGEINKVNAAVFTELTGQASAVPPGSRVQFRQYDKVYQSPLYPGDWSIFYLCKKDKGNSGITVSEVVGAPSKAKAPTPEKTAAALAADECQVILKGIEAILPYFEAIDRSVTDITRQAKFIDKTGNKLMLHAIDSEWSDGQRTSIYTWVKQSQRMIELTYKPYQLVGNHLTKTLLGAIDYVERSLNNLKE